MANGSVGPDTFSREALVLIGSALTPRGNWSTATVYNPRDLVQNGGISYIAVTAHVSTTFNSDLALGRWQTISSSSGVASSIPFTPTGSIGATNVQDAIAEVAAEAGGGGALPANVQALAGLTLSANTIPYATGPGAMTLANFTALARTITAATTQAEARAAIGVAIGVAAGNVVALDGSARLPAVDGSQLTGVVVPDLSITAAKLANTLDLSGKAVTLPPALTPAFTKFYQSPQQTITSNGTITVAHGFGELPKMVQVFAVCVTADAGWAVNDQILLNPGYHGSVGTGAVPFIDTTNVNVKIGSGATQSLFALNKSTGAGALLTNANWRIIIRAFA